MLDIDSFALEAPGAEARPVTPSITVIDANDIYGKFHMEPLERGYGVTIGSPLRRVLLSSIGGAAVTWVKIEDVLHEYSTVPHVKEEVMEILHNIAKVRIRPVSGRPGKMRLEVTGEGTVSAGDIATSSDFEIVNPEQHIATMDSSKARLAIEMNVEPGKGYRPASGGDGLPRGVLPLDAIFNPVRKVNFTIEKTRVGQVVDYERLIMEVWTDGSVSPSDTMKKAAETLVNHFFLFNSLGRPGEAGAEIIKSPRNIPPELYQTPLEKLDLSPRTLNSLKRAHLRKVGEVLEMTDEDLFRIRNFGVKSLSELNEKLKTLGFSRDSDIDAASALAMGDDDEDEESDDSEE
jgi:DNA-directed RNA polymerase subunit alpha